MHTSTCISLLVVQVLSTLKLMSALGNFSTWTIKTLWLNSQSLKLAKMSISKVSHIKLRDFFFNFSKHLLNFTIEMATEFLTTHWLHCEKL